MKWFLLYIRVTHVRVYHMLSVHQGPSLPFILTPVDIYFGSACVEQSNHHFGFNNYYYGPVQHCLNEEERQGSSNTQAFPSEVILLVTQALISTVVCIITNKLNENNFGCDNALNVFQGWTINTSLVWLLFFTPQKKKTSRVTRLNKHILGSLTTWLYDLVHKLTAASEWLSLNILGVSSWNINYMVVAVLQIYPGEFRKGRNLDE